MAQPTLLGPDRSSPNVRLIAQGSSEISIFIGVANDAYAAAVHALHAEFAP
jgi:aspartokinase